MSACERARLGVRGAVQGVGFRPFVHRLATELDLRGWVLNSGDGVTIEVEGESPAVRAFVQRLEGEKPPRAHIHRVESAYLAAAGYRDFEIRESDGSGGRSALISPDLATCADCLRELRDPADRRHRYPFLNCTNCGPRFSIIESLPYDRPRTSMRRFQMCRECAREYHDPLDRRFHAQANACPACGPHLALWDAAGQELAVRDEALRIAAEQVLAGQILALKGLGGFQVIVDAGNAEAVARLRARKHREEKPFALLYPSLARLGHEVEVSPLEDGLLASAEAPIVIFSRLLGAMLPYTPLHHLLMEAIGRPVVATSGNPSDEPICIDEHEALARLASIADLWLVHDRPILRAMDDSVVRVMAGRALILRRARGYAPLPVPRPGQGPVTLALGAQMKSTVALAAGGEVYLSQHLGDLDTLETCAAFRRSTEDLPRLYDAAPEQLVCDLHPDYFSSRFASARLAQRIAVQHHWAHFAACLADNELTPPALGIIWDGTGHGPDGTVWGGEFLLAAEGKCARVAHLLPFLLPGGEAAILQPWRLALSVLHTALGAELWSRPELLARFPQAALPILRRMLETGLNCPVTTSAGRLFDAVSALLGLCVRTTFEGQAAMELEYAARDTGAAFDCPVREGSPMQIDWRPMILKIVAAHARGETAGALSAAFHRGLVEAAVTVARKAGQPRVALSGGCFQNKFLTETLIARLREVGLQPCWHRRAPPNDGGIALGQIAALSYGFHHPTPCV